MEIPNTHTPLTPLDNTVDLGMAIPPLRGARGVFVRDSKQLHPPNPPQGGNPELKSTALTPLEGESTEMLENLTALPSRGESSLNHISYHRKVVSVSRIVVDIEIHFSKSNR